MRSALRCRVTEEELCTTFCTPLPQRAQRRPDERRRMGIYTDESRARSGTSPTRSEERAVDLNHRTSESLCRKAPADPGLRCPARPCDRLASWGALCDSVAG